MKTQLIRASMAAEYFPFLGFALKEDKCYFQLDGGVMDDLITLISVFRYKPTPREQRDGISISRSLYYYLKSGYEKLPF